MEYSDDKINTENTYVNGDVEGTTAPSGSVADKQANSADASEKSVGFSELVSVAIKAVAVALSVILLLTGLLAVALPLNAMRVYNTLGMTDRAVDFGARYISRELKANNATETDENGNYTALALTPELTNSEMDEALYVCIYNSYKLMNEYYESGNTELGAYYAEYVEKYTRMYLSLNDVSALNNTKSAKNISAMPLIAMRPSVYSYGHSMRVMNYRARSFLGTTDKMLFNSNASGNAVTTLDERTNTLFGINIPGEKGSQLMSNIDWYVDYIGCISEYLDARFIAAGIENDLSTKVYVNDTLENVLVWTEPAVNMLYRNTLKGDEFSLLITRDGGYTNVYTNLKRFNEYARLAAAFMPSDANNNKLDEMLHKLYWLQAFSKLSIQMQYLDAILYYNSEMFGMYGSAVRTEYGTWQTQSRVDHNGIKDRELSAVFTDELQAYIKQYQT